MDGERYPPLGEYGIKINTSVIPLHQVAAHQVSTRTQVKCNAFRTNIMSHSSNYKRMHRTVGLLYARLQKAATHMVKLSCKTHNLSGDS